MVKNPLVKDLLREIRGSKSRFISIFIMVALGAIFLAGLKTTAPDMERTADKYFDDQSLMDVRVISTLGLTEEDVQAHSQLDIVSRAEGAWCADAMVYGADHEWVVKVHSLGDLNRPLLTEGRMPEGADECLVEAKYLSYFDAQLGDTVTVHPGDGYADLMSTTEFTIVGIMESPYYISYTRGSATVGDGSVDSFIYVPREAFDAEYYTEMFLTIHGAEELLCFSDEYDDLIDDAIAQLEDFGQTRAQLRYDDIVTAARDQLEEGKTQLSDAQAEAQTQLEDAKKQLEEARTKLDSGSQELEAQSQQTRQELEDAKAQLDAAETELNAKQEEINQGFSQLYAGIDQLNAAQREAETALADAQAAIDQGEAEYAANLAALETAKAQLEAAKLLMEAAPQEEEPQEEPQEESETPDREPSEETAPEEQEPSPQERLLAQEEAIALAETQLTEAREQLDKAKEELEAQRQQVQQELELKRWESDNAQAQLKSAQTQLDQGREELETQRTAYEEGKAQAEAAIADAQAELTQGETEYQQGLEEYQSALEEFESTFAEKWQEISDSETQISKLDKGQWYVLGRSTNPGYVGYGQDADRMRALASVFPIIFFVVAALVCLTTMTRMVEEHRTEIGAVKALGYSTPSAAAKYVVYALTASLGGSIVGLVIGCNLIPRVIFTAYDLLYDLPELVVPFYPDYSLATIGASVLCTVGATLVAIVSAMREAPASLMRPRAPKPGKRVFLERIDFIWSRLGFIHKVSIRNLFRYKKRFFMTIIGIAGCTALIVTGFGLKDSVFAITEKQFGQIFSYDLQVDLDEEASQARTEEVQQLLETSSQVESMFYGRVMSVSVESDTRSETAYQLVPFDTEAFEQGFNIRTFKGGHHIDLPEEGVIIGEKLAELLDVQVGDTITLVDDVRAQTTVAAINEQYCFHYIYMTPEYYQQLFGHAPELNVAYLTLTESDEGSIASYASLLMEHSAVKACTNQRTMAATFSETMSVINLAVTVIIVAAAALAFVVLYNLSNINITERIRELATIKVLGFYDREVSWYVYRENLVLTFMGMGLGLVLGKFMSTWLTKTVEVDIVMFGRRAEPSSYVYAALLTLVFSIVVNVFTHFRLKKIPMVESLKTVE